MADCPLPSPGATGLPCGFPAGHDGECLPKWLARWAMGEGRYSAEKMDALRRMQKNAVREGVALANPAMPNARPTTMAG